MRSCGSAVFAALGFLASSFTLGEASERSGWLHPADRVAGKGWVGDYTLKDSAQAFELKSVVEGGGGSLIAAGDLDDVTVEGMDACLLSVNPQGSPLWLKIIKTSQRDWFEQVIRTSDGGLALGGYLNYSSGQSAHGVWLAKLASNGAVQWQKSFTKNGADIYFGCLLQNVSGDLFVFMRAGTGSLWILKLTAGGTMLWQKSYSPSTTLEINVTLPPGDLESFPGGAGPNVVATPDGGVLMTTVGLTLMPPSLTDLAVVKFDSNGNVVWARSYPMTWAGHQMWTLIPSTGIVRLTDGSFVLNGEALDSTGVSNRILTVGIDQNGARLWGTLLDPELKSGSLGTWNLAGPVPTRGSRFFQCFTRIDNDENLSDMNMLKMAASGKFAQSRKWDWAWLHASASILVPTADGGAAGARSSSLMRFDSTGRFGNPASWGALCKTVSKKWSPVFDTTPAVDITQSISSTPTTGTLANTKMTFIAVSKTRIEVAFSCR